MGYLSRKISDYGKKIFTDYMRKSNKPIRWLDANWVDDYYVYSIFCKRAHLLKTTDGSQKQIWVQGLNENNLATIRRRVENTKKKGMIIFVDADLKAVYKITLLNWDHGCMEEGIKFPYESLSAVGGKIMYTPISQLKIVTKMTHYQFKKLRKMIILNKSNPNQPDLFL